MRPPLRVLILGGTGEALALAKALTALPDVAVVSSLAGRTQQPLPLPGDTRVGGFGGASGLADYLRQQADLLIDATHPFAAQITAHGAAAAAAADVPRLMLVRPAWVPVPGRDRWIEVDSHAAAAACLPGLGQRFFLTIGRQELAEFAHLQSLWFLMRMIDPPAAGAAVPPGEVLLARGPFDLAAERSLLQRYQLDAIISKNSGGDATYAKILAAQQLQLPVVMVQRPLLPPGEQAGSVAEALAWLGQWR